MSMSRLYAELAYYALQPEAAMPTPSSSDVSALQDPVRQLPRRPPLPESIKMIAVKAAGKSTNALQVLVDSFRTDNSLAEYPQLLDIFFRYLQVAPPPLSENESMGNTALLAAIALGGVSNALKCFRLTRYDNSYLMEAFAHSWPAIWKWMVYLYSRTKSPSADSSEELGQSDIGTKTVILRIISYIRYFPWTSASKAIETTQGVFLMLAEIWIHLSEIDNENLANDSADLTGTIAYLSNFDGTQINQFLGAAGGDAVSSAVLKNMRLATNGGAEWIRAFPFLINLSTLFGEANPALYNILLSRNIMVDVCRAFNFFSCLRTLESTKDTWRLGFCIVSCTEFISRASRITDGFTWIIQAVRCKLIQSTLKCSRQAFDEFKIDSHAIVMIKMLMTFSVYRSVLRAIGRALRDPAIAVLESQLPEDGDFKKVWLEFRSLVTERAIVKAVFDETGKYSQRCSSSECTSVETIESFRLCGACHLACYCSKSCQQWDWKQGEHRSGCETLRRDRAGMLVTISARDQAFFGFLAKRELLQHRENITHLRDTFLAANPTARQGFIIKLDFSNCDIEFTICSHDSFLSLLRGTSEPHEASTIQGYAELLQGSLGSSYSLIHLAIGIPYGANRHVTLIPSQEASDLFGL